MRRQRVQPPVGITTAGCCLNRIQEVRSAGAGDRGPKIRRPERRRPAGLILLLSQLATGAVMTLNPEIKFGDIAIVFATLLGPILAVQAQAFVERHRARQTRRQNIFYVLMRTRATPVAPDGVNALNAVPLEFYNDRTIIDAYRAFITQISSPVNQPTPQAWESRRIDLLMDLIQKISMRVGYKFDVVQLKAEFYAPQAHKVMEDEQTQIRQGLAKVLSGQSAIPMDVRSVPADADAVAGYKAIVTGERALKVEQVTPSGSAS